MFAIQWGRRENNGNAILPLLTLLKRGLDTHEKSLNIMI